MAVRGGWEQRRVLILVKTYPNPSEKYREVVCTAALDEERRLIRLYPIQFRAMGHAQHFSKWQYVDLRMRKARTDSRIESYEVDQESIRPGKIIEASNGWDKRWRLIEHLLSPSVDAIARMPEASRPSLAIIKPKSFELRIKAHSRPMFSERERRKLLGVRGADTLFGDYSKNIAMLEKIPVKFQYCWRCDDSICRREHSALFEDWEIGEAYRKWRRQYQGDDELYEALHNRFVDLPRKKGNLYLVLGTHSLFRKTWLAIGHFQPVLSQISSAEQLSFSLK